MTAAHLPATRRTNGKRKHGPACSGCGAFSAIVYWNTVYLGRAVDHMRRSGKVVPDDLLQHVAPLGWNHISLTGRLSLERLVANDQCHASYCSLGEDPADVHASCWRLAGGAGSPCARRPSPGPRQPKGAHLTNPKDVETHLPPSAAPLGPASQPAAPTGKGAHRASSADRMRRTRQRRRQGLRCITIELREREIDALIRRKRLSAGDRANLAAIRKALYGFLDANLE